MFNSLSRLTLLENFVSGRTNSPLGRLYLQCATNDDRCRETFREVDQESGIMNSIRLGTERVNGNEGWAASRDAEALSLRLTQR